jgi:hypothetical protein
VDFIFILIHRMQTPAQNKLKHNVINVLKNNYSMVCSVI